MSKLNITLKEILDEAKCSTCILRKACDDCENYSFDHTNRSKNICDYLEEVQEEN